MCMLKVSGLVDDGNLHIECVLIDTHISILTDTDHTIAIL